MPTRTLVVFWGSTAAAAIFLGSAWAAAAAMGSDPPDVAVFAFSALGFVATAFVAGRIALLVARTQRRARRTRVG